VVSHACRTAGRLSGRLAGVILCLGLSACAMDGFSFAPRGSTVDRQTLPPPTYQASAAQQASPLDGAPSVSTARQMSTGEVTVYDLDDPNARTVYDSPMRPLGRGGAALADGAGLMPLSTWVHAVRNGAVNGGGVPSAADSSVLLFPVDGAVFSPTESGSPPPRIAPGYLASDVSGKLRPTAATAQVEPEAPGAPLRIYFDHNSTRLGPSAKQALTGVAQKVKNSGGASAVFVEGHASRRGTLTDPARRETTNLKKSLDRAYAVSDTLIRQGVPVRSIVTSGFGDGYPARTDGGASARGPEAASRRVDVKVAP
jgi:outer membrane protein OmpA-like peptidoglycan-associated protein